MSQALARLLKSTSSRNQPRQVALAAAVGVMCGLLPKASILFAVLAGIAFCLPIHLLACMATTLIIGCFTDYVAPAAGRLGLWSLTASPASDFWMSIGGLPLIPWLGLHNTVVQGSLLIGLLFFVPSYVIALSVVRTLYGTQPPAPHRQSAANADRDRQSEPVPWVAPRSEPRAQALEPIDFRPVVACQDSSPVDFDSPSVETGAAEVSPTSEAADDTELRLTDLVSESAAQSDVEYNGDEVLQRAQEMTALMDELLSTMDEPCPTSPHPSEKPVQAAGDGRTEATGLGDRVSLAHIVSAPSGHIACYEAQHEESLRYLLQHLKQCQARARQEW